VDIAFDAPSRDWSGQLSKPTVNLFLYDLREAESLRPSEWTSVTNKNGRRLESRPPMVMECSYAVTAWTHAVEDEHRLLSQVLAILFAFPQLPEDRLNGRLVNGSQPWPIKGRIGQGKGEKSDFWSAVGGQYKVSLDYVVRLSVESGAKLERGPEVRTQTIRTSLRTTPRARCSRCTVRPGASATNMASRCTTSGSRCPTSAPGRLRTPQGGSSSTACRRVSTGCWRAPLTAARPTHSWKFPEQASTW